MLVAATTIISVISTPHRHYSIETAAYNRIEIFQNVEHELHRVKCQIPRNTGSFDGSWHVHRQPLGAKDLHTFRSGKCTYLTELPKAPFLAFPLFLPGVAYSRGWWQGHVRASEVFQ